MTRLCTIALLATSACSPLAFRGLEPGGLVWDGKPNVDAARELDQEGVRTFGEGHYATALAYFRAARDMGGPSSELWNVARCLERLEEPEDAVGVLDEYLTQRDLLPGDRAEAQREAAAIRGRSSPLLVTTRPTGATVTIDSETPLGPTPSSATLRPGAHVLVVRREGHIDRTVRIEATFGRPVIVALDLYPSRQ